MLHHRQDLNSSVPLSLKSSLRNNLADWGLCKVKFQSCVLAFRLEGTEGGDETPWGSGGCLGLVGSCSWGQDPAPWGNGWRGFCLMELTSE